MTLNVNKIKENLKNFQLPNNLKVNNQLLKRVNLANKTIDIPHLGYMNVLFGDNGDLLETILPNFTNYILYLYYDNDLYQVMDNITEFTLDSINQLNNLAMVGTYDLTIKGNTSNERLITTFETFQRIQTNAIQQQRTPEMYFFVRNPQNDDRWYLSNYYETFNLGDFVNNFGEDERKIEIKLKNG